MTISLPQNPSLENLKKQAKTLKRAWQAGEENALGRIRALHPQFDKLSGTPRLADCQLVLARELGFKSWPELKIAVQAANLELPEQFITLACLCHDDPHYDHRSFHTRASEMLRSNPWLACADIWSAATAGNAAVVRAFLDEDSHLADQPGPHGWPPLICACYSRVTPLERSHSTSEVVKALLERGADPNACIMKGNADERLDQTTRRFTALRGLFGGGSTGPVNQPPHPHWRELAELLLRSGADPADEEVILQNSVESLEMLLRYGLKPDAPARRQIGKPTANATLLGRALGMAARRGDVSLAELLLANGAQLDEPFNSRSPWEHAILRGHLKIARMLEKAGAPIADLTEEERFTSLCLAADEDGAREMLGRIPGIAERSPKDMVHRAVGTGRREAVRLVLDLHFDPNWIDDNAPIHMAGTLAEDEEMLQILLRGGASLKLRDPWYDGTAIGWAEFFDYHALRDRLFMENDICLFDALDFDRLDRAPDILAGDSAALERPFATCLSREPKPEEWQTPLLRMVDKGKTQAVRLLLQYGANTDIYDSAGRSLVALARDKGFHEIADLLQQHGART